MSEVSTCDNCETEIAYDAVHDVNGFVWCTSCEEAEQQRHTQEDVIGKQASPFLPAGKKQLLFSRPPKHVLPKEDYEKFGYK